MLVYTCLPYFNPDVEVYNKAHQDLLWKFNAGDGYDNFNDFLQKNSGAKIFMATTKSKKLYTDVTYGENDYIMFGKESAGIPEEILLQYQQTAVRIPMFEQARSLNLSNAVAVVLYEALRQQDFKGLLKQGQLHRHTW